MLLMLILRRSSGDRLSCTAVPRDWNKAATPLAHCPACAALDATRWSCEASWLMRLRQQPGVALVGKMWASGCDLPTYTSDKI